MKKILLSVLILTTSIVNAQIINFSDPAFKAILLQADTDNYIACNVKIDANNDGEIDQSEALAVYCFSITQGNIIDLTGIEYFTNVTSLGCVQNNLQTVDLSSLTNLEILGLGANQLTSVNLNGLNNLRFINIGGNQLTEVDFSTLPALKIVIASLNQFTHMDFSNNPLFEQLRCNENPNLSWINIRNNRSQIFTQTPYNGCWDNCPNLTTICVDDNEVIPTQNFLSNCGITQPITITMDCELDINEVKNNNSFVIYPNPSASGIYTLLFDEAKTATVEVYTLLGQKIYSEQVAGQKEHQLLLNNVAKGSYLLKATSDEKTITKTIIKQ